MEWNQFTLLFKQVFNYKTSSVTQSLHSCFQKIGVKKNPEEIRENREPTTGLEPVTSSLPRKHSTAELSRHQLKKSH
ncbi:protein of unknown function [Chryseobacterium sp. JV274]|nr:protein of unknown function [Chryseobacterium sp. JV274]